jgi:hypothetical protein
MKFGPPYLLVASLIIFGGSFAKAEQPPDIGAVEYEPRHMIAFENAVVRVFHTRIPSGYTTLYHRHGRDSIYVQIAGSTNLVNQIARRTLERATTFDRVRRTIDVSGKI